MAKNHIFTPQTIDADDDDTDICPVCDGQCTCQKQQRQQQPLPSLKIKLTVPPSLIAKHLLVSSNNAVQTTSGSGKHGYVPRKRGRPPKSRVTPSRSRAHPAVSPFDYKSRPSSSVGAAKIKQNIKARAALSKRVAVVGRRQNPRKNFDYEEDDEEGSTLTSLTDVDMDRSYPSSHFPTFVSASALESFGSSSDSDSDPGHDSSTPKDDPRHRERDKARTRRQLLGDDPLRKKLGHPINNEWVIRPRKTSVDLSEAEGGANMDVDSDSDEEDEISGGLQEDAEDGAETTPLLPFLECQDSETTDNLSAVQSHHKQQQQRRRHFVRLGKTGWSFSSSEDEESSFDAELFFRHLYDSSASSSSPSEDEDEEEELTEGQDNGDAESTAPFFCPPRVESLPFELAESWDGGVVFTNGEGVGTGDVTVGFVEVERLGRGGFGFRGRDDSDVEMDMRMSMATCATCLEDGYLEEDEECEGDEDEFSFDGDEGGIEGGYSDDEVEEEVEGGGGSGDTTDEDLVGANSLPNQRAMSLFKVPLPVWGSVSAIDPLSLVSSRPRRELEMLEGVEGVGEKRRRGKGKNKGKGRMRRETREKGERERRKEGKKRREVLPSPLDILEGKGTLWGVDERMDVSEVEEETSCLSSSSGPFHRGHKALRSPRTPTPTPARSPTTPVPTTPALSTTTSFTTTGPRRGVFVVPPVVSEWRESAKRKGKAREAMVIIGEDRKGEDVPSPHPRKRSVQSLGGDGDVVEQVLRRHLVDTLGAASIANISDATATAKTAPPTPYLGPPFSPSVDDVFSSKAIQLADVLDAEFLKDDDTEDQRADREGGNKEKSDCEDGHYSLGKEQEVKGGLDLILDPLGGSEEVETVMDMTTTPTTFAIPFQGQGEQTPQTPASPLIPSDADLAADMAALKNLSRWDVISVGAFRQTQQQVREEGVGKSAHHHVGLGHEQQLAGAHARTPGSSADYGNAMKRSGKFALGVLWRGGGKGAKPASSSPSPGTIRRTASGGMIGSKHAKKRKLMMSSSSTSVMKEPLVLPATSIGAAGGSNVASTSTAAPSHVNANVVSVNSSTNANGKTRKEARRERKLQKRNASQPYNPHSHSLHPHSHHQHHHQHMYHTHYHHPNAKTRGVASAQRLGGWFVGGGGSGSGGGGSGGSGGAGTWSGSSGFGGGFGGLGF